MTIIGAIMLTTMSPDGVGIDRPSDLWIQLGGLALTALALAITGTWQLAKMRDELANQSRKQRKELDAEHETLRKDTGETIAAIRQKVTDNELAAARSELELYKTFVRRDTFSESISRIEKMIDARLEKMEAATAVQVNKLEVKIDRLGERGRPGAER